MRDGRIIVIADEDAVFGLGLIGFEGLVVTSEDEARQALADARRNPEVALILLAERFAAAVSADERLEGDGGPLIVEIPGPEGPSGLGLQQRIAEALGVRLEG